MLIKHLYKLPSKSALVNKTLIGLLIAGSAIALPATASASSYMNIKTSEVKVKFKSADLNTEDGLDAVYTMLEKKAANACAFGHNLDLDGNLISKEACAENLLSQFITSSETASLKQYHLMKKTERNTAYR